jgi:hypothetical protein
MTSMKTRLSRVLALFPVALMAPAILATPEVAQGQTSSPLLNLEVRNVDNADSCVFASFRPEFKITNNGTQPVSVTALDIRMFFNNPLQEGPIEFVNATFATVFNANGSITGNYANVVQFDSAPPNPSCVVAPDRLANQTRHISFSPIGSQVLIPANGGFMTVIAQYRRNGGQAPFDAGCNDFSKLPADPARAFHNDKFFNLVMQNPMGPPHILFCEFLNATTVDPNSGIDAGVDACGTNGCAF